MNVEWVESATAVTAFALSLCGVLAAAVGALRWLSGWVDDDRIAISLDRMDKDLATAQRLQAIGEEAWAAETRERAWMVPLRRLARFEVNRERMARFVIVFVGWALLIAAVVCTAGKPNQWWRVEAKGLLLAAMAIHIWWVVTKPRFERAVTRRANEKYEKHNREGRVATALPTAAQDSIHKSNARSASAAPSVR